MLKSDSLPKIIWLWIPILVFIAQIILEISLSHETLAVLLSEGGPHEILEFLVMGAAFFVALFTLFKLDWKTQKLLGLWVGLFALASFYITGEEMSWGQQLLHWNTPESWSQINNQNETNLHNTSDWLDQKPRMLLQIGILFGGIIFPLIRKFKPGLLPQKFKIIYPPDILSVTAFIALLVNMGDRVNDFLKNIVLFERASEVEELYLFYFVLLYLIVLRQRIVSARSLNV
ncbi:MAG: hypothetical protein KA155_10140 [Alphaproteobacteria bacterium]|jgi:glucan phosphoethanolaminetransferase (alkaline phosphatase superfamily)|nr:hypothetical protein [Alphaproteobacteria bacterium]